MRTLGLQMSVSSYQWIIQILKTNMQFFFHFNVDNHWQYRFLKKMIKIYPFRLLVDRCGETPCHSRKLVEKILNIVGHRDKDDFHSEIYFIQVLLNLFSRTQSNNYASGATTFVLKSFSQQKNLFMSTD